MHRLDEAVVAWRKPRKEVPSVFLERKLTPQTSFAFFFGEERQVSECWAEQHDLVEGVPAHGRAVGTGCSLKIPSNSNHSGILGFCESGHCWHWLFPLQQHGKSGTNLCVCFPQSHVSLLRHAQGVNDLQRAKSLVPPERCDRSCGLLAYWNQAGVGGLSERQVSVTRLLFLGSEQGQLWEIWQCVVWKEVNDPIMCSCLDPGRVFVCQDCYACFIHTLRTWQRNWYDIVIPATSTSTKSCFAFPIFFSSFFFLLIAIQAFLLKL